MVTTLVAPVPFNLLVLFLAVGYIGQFSAIAIAKEISPHLQSMYRFNILLQTLVDQFVLLDGIQPFESW